jgi:anti-anti-sigma factor
VSEIVVVVTEPLVGGTADPAPAAAGTAAPAFARRARQLTVAVARRPDRLVVDLSACPRIDAAAIGLLLKIHGEMLRAHGTLLLRRPHPRVRRMLRLARVDQVLEVEDPGVLADAR